MKIVIAPDKFKGTLPASEAAAAIAQGLSAACLKNGKTGCEIILSPMADGGEGSAELILGRNGKYKETHSYDSLMRPITVSYGMTEINGSRTAIIESSAAAGLFRLSKEERNPLKTTSYGLGVMLSDAIENGYYHIVVTVGGTATNDCGAGMLAALGCVFNDPKGNIIEVPVGGSLSEITDIDLSSVYEIAGKCRIKVLCDVDNPLLGDRGAAAVFSPQKGADPKTITMLENGALHFSELLKSKTGNDYSAFPGTGAGGGIAWALKIALNAEIINGAEFISAATGLNDAIATANLIITGEGKFDSQSLSGKVVGYAARKSKEFGIPVIVMCGKRDDTVKPEMLSQAGISSVYTLTERVSPNRAFNNASEELQRMAYDIFITKSSFF